MYFVELTFKVCGVTVVHVTVAQGLLRGVAVTSRASGGTYYRFQGIAYAKPPIGELRFKVVPAPQDPDSWIGTKDALSEGASCPQSGKSQEDCLYLNVYSPQGACSPRRWALLPRRVGIASEGAAQTFPDGRLA
uniref:Carboxylesterase type B domain-containing protein n=1 Tax=Timema genevievae TaxID=629358 RepID=A0A7R9K3E9_TIMGE|nr:unnamed protein product [Timema genevievae]